MGKSLIIFFVAALSLWTQVEARELSGPDQAIFIPTRRDQAVPPECQQLGSGNFASMGRPLQVGVMGARIDDLDRRIPVTPDQLKTLLRLLGNLRLPRSTRKQLIRSLPENLVQKYRELEAQREVRDFKFRSVGDILEALVLLDFASAYSNSDYFVTGGVAYYFEGGDTTGELDLLVIRRADCQVIQVAEVKSSLRPRGSRAQLTRLIVTLGYSLGEAWRTQMLNVFAGKTVDNESSSADTDFALAWGQRENFERCAQDVFTVGSTRH